MRNYIDMVNRYLLKEATTPLSRKPPPQDRSDHTDVSPDPSLANPLDIRPDQSIVQKGTSNQTPRLPGSTTSSPADVRLRSELTGFAGAMMGDFLSRDHPADEISDEEARTRAGAATNNDNLHRIKSGHLKPRNPENLPAVIKHELMAKSDRQYPDDWEPRWTMVRHLPGYMQNAIRSLGREVFRQFTNVPLEDIQVMASPMINSDNDINRMMRFIIKNGVQDDNAAIDFNRSFPGYHAEVMLYRLADYEFLVVEDLAGKYIYGWPGGRGVAITGIDPKTPRIKQ